MSLNTGSIPVHLLYTKDHEWLDPKTGKVGITDFAQDQLGDIVYIEVSSLGEGVATHDKIGTIESVKTVSDIFSPLQGLIVEINAKLSSSPEVVNKSPYEDGWILRFESSALQTSHLLSATEYSSLVSK